MIGIRPIPQIYRKIMFRSTLEADWAATLDHVGISWEYEPEGILLPSGSMYRPDFYLPNITTWLEVKGPHDERLTKVRELELATICPPSCDRLGCCDPEDHDGPGCPCMCLEGHYAQPWRMVVIGRAARPAGVPDSRTSGGLRGQVQRPNGSVFTWRCRECLTLQWTRSLETHQCRSCQVLCNEFLLDEGLEFPFGVPFARAPRAGAR